jgi:hypothetical protein
MDTFSLFVVVPKKGPHKLGVRDVSDLGMRFDIELESEVPGEFAIQVGDTLDIELYLNQTLSLPLKVQVVRFAGAKDSGPRQIGVALTDLYAPSYRAFAAFIQLLDAVSESQQATAQKN